MSKKILIFAPATNWIVHHQLDCVLGAALANRGCEVRVIGCDGLFERCIVKGIPPSEGPCESCQLFGREWFAKFRLPVTQMSAMLTAEDRKEVTQWVATIDMSDFGHARFKNWEIGKWMLWNLHGDLLNGTLDFAREEVQSRARDFALQGAYVAIAASRILEEFKPDRAICYNGTNSYYRVFFELCRERGIPALIHERGTTDGSFILVDNGSTYQNHFDTPPEWEAHWENTPLTTGQWQSITQFFDAREKGGGTNFQRMHDFQSETEIVRRRLRIPSEAKVLLALTTGDWEFGMCRSYGGLGLMWETQLEWLEATARICAEQGWFLVIRHHPLGAGRKSYPRGSEFLTALIRHRSSWGGDVRVIMAAENISTYDLMRVCDAGVAGFTSSGAEAILHGLPMVCVVASSFRYMGMDWVRCAKDYAAALVKAMNTGVLISEAALTHAFRFAHFRYFIAGSSVFSSVRIKNVYEPDFRLESPDALVPGVDPELDRVCEHMIHGSPLHRSPETVPSPDDEAQLVRVRRQQLLAERARSSQIQVPQKFSKVTVWRLGASLQIVEGKIPPPDGWRSRHAEVEFDWLPLDCSGGWEPVRMTLEAKAKDTDAPYVHLHACHMALDESALARAVDALEQAENKDKTGVLFGCYVLDQNGFLGLEWNTGLYEADPKDLPPAAIAVLSEPLTALGLVVWRKEKLPGWLGALQVDELSVSQNMLRSFLDTDAFVNISEPAIYLTEQPSAHALLAQAETQVAAGDLNEALKTASTIQARFGNIPGLRPAMARWLISAGRPAQAEPFLHLGFQEKGGGPELFKMLEQVLLSRSVKRPCYEDYHSAVDTVEGYMCPGQEKFLHDKVASLPRDARIVELGACFGRSTVAMAYACVGTRRRVLSIDTFFGNDGFMGRVARRYHVWRGNVCRWGLEHYASAIAGYTHPVLREMPETEAFDFAFIDASHEYHDVLLDFELTYARTKPGGWIAFHDVTPGWPGSWRVWEQTAKHLLTNHEIETTLTCGQKQADVPWQSREDTWPGYAAYFAEYLAHGEDSAARDLDQQFNTRVTGRAMLSIIQGQTPEQRLADASPVVRQMLTDMLTQEAREDPWVHYFAALTQEDVDDKIASHHFAEASRLGLGRLVESRS